MSAADRDDHWGGLVASVVAGDRGPVVVLSGEADFTSLEQLSAVINGQPFAGTRWLTVDVSGLRFADTAAIRALILAAKALKGRGGNLILLHPQRPVARVLELLGADQMFTIRTMPDPGDGTG
jgi:anti-sigma B factor antagonist